MSNVSNIGSGSSVSGTASSGGSGGLGALDTDDFTRIILFEMSKQDPLAPNDTNTLIQQMANIRSIQSNTDLSDQLKKLVAENSLSSASNLIGKYVSGVAEGGERVVGLVASVSRTKDGAILNLANGKRVNMSKLDEVVDPDRLPTSN